MLLYEKLVDRAAQRFGLQVSRISSNGNNLPAEVAREDRLLIDRVQPYTMTSPGRAEWSSWHAQLDPTPLEARLLRTVPQPSFTVARLGSNDDASFLLDLPPQATLVCPRFHLYDFSPVEDFSEAYECIDQADVVLLTDQFRAFQNRWRGVVVTPVVNKVNAEFTCLRVDDRQLCTRR